MIPLMRHLGSPPLTLMHGDYRLDNLFFGQAVGGPALRVVDWQGVGCSRPPLDVAYFISGNLEPELSVPAESGLVQAYHAELMARGARDYPFDCCWRDYQLSKLLLAYRLILGGDLIDLSHERGQLLLDRFCQRLWSLLPAESPEELLEPH